MGGGPEGEAASALLNTFAFLAPDAIPRELVRQVLNKSGGEGHEREKAVAVLSQCSLIQEQGDTLAMHRLVQLGVRLRLPRDERVCWLGRVIALLTELFPADCVALDHGQRCSRLLPHVRAAMRHAQFVKSPRIAGLLAKVGDYLLDARAYDQAYDMLEQAVSVFRNMPDMDPQAVAGILFRFAEAAAGCNRMAQVRAVVERDAAWTEAGSGVIDRVIHLFLAALATADGDWKRARIHGERVFGMAKDGWGEEGTRW